MKLRMRRALLLGVSLAISVVAALWFIKAMSGHWSGMADAFARARYAWLVPAVAFVGLSYVFRILRWRLFLAPVARVGFAPLTSATLIGFMSTAVLPLRAGEVIRPFVLSRKTGLAFGHAVGTDAGLARAFDMLFGAGLLFLLAWGWMMVDPRALVGGAESVAGTDLLADRLRVLAGNASFAALFGLSLAGLAAMAACPRLVLRVGEFFLRPLPESWRRVLSGFLHSVVESLRFLRSPLGTACGVLLTAGVWLSYPAAAWCVARGFGADLSLLGVIVIQVIITVAIIVPQAPGFLGVFQVAAMEGARLFGAPEGTAGAFALVLWAVHTIPITVVGLGCVWYEGLSLKGLARASREATERTEGEGPAAEE